MGALQFVDCYGPTDLVYDDSLFVAHHLLFLVEGTASYHHLDVIVALRLVVLIALENNGVY